MAKFNIVLVSPEIPGNTGSIGRTCVALDLKLIIIGKPAFDLSEKAVRRAGLDYWKYVNLVQYQNFQEFFDQETPLIDNLFFFTKTAQQSFFGLNYTSNCYLIFGSETKGLPPKILEKYDSRKVKLPMFSEKIRSLNLSNTATAAAYEALRVIEFN